MRFLSYLKTRLFANGSQGFLTKHRRSSGESVPGFSPACINLRSNSKRPQPSGRLSLNIPNNPSNTRSVDVITPALSGSLKGDNSRPLVIKAESYSKNNCLFLSSNRPISCFLAKL